MQISAVVHLFKAAYRRYPIARRQMLHQAADKFQPRKREVVRSIKWYSVKKALTGLLLFLLTAFVYYQTPVHYLSDSSYSLLMDEAILHHGTPDMRAYEVPREQSAAFINHGYMWTIDIVKGRLLYLYPWGGALLSLPAVALFNADGIRVAPHGIYLENHEQRMQMILTTIICALIVWIVLETAALILPLGWSLAIALSAAFGTQLLSSSSRDLWPQNWYLLLVIISIWLLLKARPRPALMGTMLAWACFARPPGVPVAMMVGLYMFVEYGWRRFAACAAAGAAWSTAFAVVTLFFFGQLTSLKYDGGFEFPHGFGFRLESILLSPSRGLLVFVPVILLPVYFTLRYWQVLPNRPLALLAAAAIASNLAVSACWQCWWGGGVYGPRLLTESIPWFVLLAILGLRAFIDDRGLTTRRRSAIIAVALMLVTISVAMNTVGAVSPAAMDWNDHPSIESNLDRLWDWRHPPFLAWSQR
jgi:hypothetical protein